MREAAAGVDGTDVVAELEELEQRMERLRALYEQYFLGFEKIEPSVLRKDVERRFWLLRRVQMRNTATRFKLQTLSQRYNTYQQYWQRCLREIDAGTYRRHVIRAEKRFGKEALTIAARRRLGAYRIGPATESPAEVPDESTAELSAEKSAARPAEAPIEHRAKQGKAPFLTSLTSSNLDIVDTSQQEDDFDLDWPDPAPPTSTDEFGELDFLESLMARGSTSPTRKTPPEQAGRILVRPSLGTPGVPSIQYTSSAPSAPSASITPEPSVASSASAAQTPPTDKLPVARRLFLLQQ